MVRVHENRSREAAPKLLAPALGACARALVLDGDPAAAGELRRALERCGVTAVEAFDGTSGVALLIDQLLSLDVLVVALELPDWDAVRLTRFIRQAGGERDLGIVVVVPEETPALREELHRLGVNAVVDRRNGLDVAALAALAVMRSRGGGEPARDEPPSARAAPVGAGAVMPFARSLRACLA